MYTTRKDKPLDAVTMAVLARLLSIAQRNSMAYFVIGATARDIVMTHVFGIDAGRATRDVDLAIALENWQQFAAVKQDFIDSGDFQAGTQAHRLYFQQDRHGIAYPVDLIPFGAIERAKNEIAWPPDMLVVMNVAGYAEALRSALEVDVGDGVLTKVVSLPALAALKLLAWQDRGLEDSKDAHDFFFLLKNYSSAGNIDRVYDAAESLLAPVDYDPDLAGAALLGHDAARILDPVTRLSLLTLLRDPILRDRLVLHVGRRLDPAVVDRFIGQFQRGLTMPALDI